LFTIKNDSLGVLDEFEKYIIMLFHFSIFLRTSKISTNIKSLKIKLKLKFNKLNFSSFPTSKSSISSVYTGLI